MAAKIAKVMRTYCCEGCKAVAQSKQLPRGWKSVDNLYCKDCFRSRYIIRAVTLPVGTPLDCDWATLRKTLQTAWRLSTDFANWVVQQLYRLDTVTDEKTPAAIKDWYGYGVARDSYPQFAQWVGAKNSLNVIQNGVKRQYVKRRFDVVVRHQQRLLTHQYPFPYPVDADGWKTRYEDGGFPAVSVQLPEVGSVWLRLKRSADFGRQLKAFRQLHDGKAIKAEAAVYADRKQNVLVKLVGWFPRTEQSTDRPHACVLHTDPNAMLVAEIDGRQPWILNCDHLRRWKTVHTVYLQRTSEDLKREKRMDRRQRQNLLSARQLRSDKYDARVETAVNQIAAQVAAFCRRQKVGSVVYDDSVKGYIPDGFAWHRLKTRLLVKLDEIGVKVVTSGDETQTEGD
jgi:hypothetical protein